MLQAGCYISHSPYNLALFLSALVAQRFSNKVHRTQDEPDPVRMAALLKIDPNWKQPKCPSVGEWISTW